MLRSNALQHSYTPRWVQRFQFDCAAEIIDSIDWEINEIASISHEILIINEGEKKNTIQFKSSVFGAFREIQSARTHSGDGESDGNVGVE